MNKYFLVIAVLAIIAFALFIAGCVQPPQPTPSPSIVACTADAELCPDGSYVGRIPPACKFAPCPTVKASIEPTTASPMPTVIVGDQGIYGEVTQYPIYPVCNPSDPETCEPAAYSVTVIVRNANMVEVTRFASDQNGKFRVELNPGTYILDPVNGNPYPHAEKQTVVVYSEQWTYVPIEYDTGIR